MLRARHSNIDLGDTEIALRTGSAIDSPHARICPYALVKWEHVRGPYAEDQEIESPAHQALESLWRALHLRAQSKERLRTAKIEILLRLYPWVGARDSFGG